MNYPIEIIRDEDRLLAGRHTSEDETLARAAAAVLLKHYPGWPWHIISMADQGVVIIKNRMLHDRYGQIVKLGQADTVQGRERAIMEAGGELLEIFHCPRGAMTDDALAGKRKDAPAVAEIKTLLDERYKRRIVA